MRCFLILFFLFFSAQCASLGKQFKQSVQQIHDAAQEVYGTRYTRSSGLEIGSKSPPVVIALRESSALRMLCDRVYNLMRERGVLPGNMGIVFNTLAGDELAIAAFQYAHICQIRLRVEDSRFYSTDFSTEAGRPAVTLKSPDPAVAASMVYCSRSDMEFLREVASFFPTDILMMVISFTCKGEASVMKRLEPSRQRVGSSRVDLLQEMVRTLATFNEEELVRPQIMSL